MNNRYFDNWERLVTATLRREELRELAYAHSRDPSLDSVSSNFSFTSPFHDHFRDPEGGFLEQFGVEDVLKQYESDDHEFCQAFVRFWRDELAEYLTIWNVEQFGVVLKMESKCLYFRVRKWRSAIKNVVEIYLASEKRLFDQVLGEYGSISSTSLVEASKASLLCLLNFGHGVAIGPHQPEWLYCLLDMYEVLASLISDEESLFSEEAGCSIRIEFHDLLRRLGDSAKALFMEFGNHIIARSSRTPYANGGIHPITKYVVNWILCSLEYGDTLNLILAEKDWVNLDMGSNENIGQTTISCPVAVQLRSVTSILEANLDNISNLGSSLDYIFMMNNIHYMYDKIKNSEVRRYFGDEWIREHIERVRRYAMKYARFTWNSILSFIRDNGRTGKATLKKRCQDFNIAFEDVYKMQTAWYVPNPELCEELRILTSMTVIPPYRSFVGKITGCIGEKYIKYTVHDLESYILDLLGGSQIVETMITIPDEGGDNFKRYLSLSFCCN